MGSRTVTVRATPIFYDDPRDIARTLLAFGIECSLCGPTAVTTAVIALPASEVADLYCRAHLAIHGITPGDG